jgi:hypothetical protein
MKLCNTCKIEKPIDEFAKRYSALNRHKERVIYNRSKIKFGEIQIKNIQAITIRLSVEQYRIDMPK